MKKVFYLFVVCTLFTACSNELSRDDAEKSIIEFYKLPSVQSAKLTSSAFDSKTQPYAMKAVEKGYLTVTYNPYTQQRIGNLGNVYGFTEKSEPFVIKRYNDWLLGNEDGGLVIANCLSFGEITGIAINESNKSAKVEYTCKKVGITPLGEALGIQEGEVMKCSTLFALYDDGWRIAESQSEYRYDMDDTVKMKSPSEYPFFNDKGEYINSK